MSFDTNWNIDEYKEKQEPEDYWHLRRTFMEKWKSKYTEGKVVYLARAFANIALKGSAYPMNVMQEVAWMSKDLISVTDEKSGYQNTRNSATEHNDNIETSPTCTSIIAPKIYPNNKRQIQQNPQIAHDDTIDLTEPAKKNLINVTPLVTIDLINPKPTLTVNGVQQGLKPPKKKKKEMINKQIVPVYVEPVRYQPKPPVCPDWTADVEIPFVSSSHSTIGIHSGNITNTAATQVQPQSSTNAHPSNNFSTIAQPLYTFNSLHVAVTTDPYQAFSVAQATYILEALEQRLVEWIFTSPNTIRFRGRTHLSEGALKVWCEDQQSGNWLIQEIAKLQSPIFGTKLVVRPHGISTEKVKCGLHVPTNKSIHDVRTLLAAQNPFVEVNSWVVSKVDTQVNPPGLYLHLLVPWNDVINLKANDHRMYWLLGDISIVIIEKKP